jgi:hypothetical protein
MNRAVGLVGAQEDVKSLAGLAQEPAGFCSH